jgi:hypothetical protein
MVVIVAWTAVLGPPVAGLTAGRNLPPVADAGLPRYAAQDPITLDGTGSFDPDRSGPLSYAWRQVSGPLVTITEADTATPTVSGPARTEGGQAINTFIQTDQIQQCQFELVVSDGELAGRPDTVTVFIVPDFGPMTLEQQNPPFDPNKPTVFYFSGGDCVCGFPNEQRWGYGAWLKKANTINFPEGYVPDKSSPGYRTYYRTGDMIIVFLSRVAPLYQQPIQTIGWSTGGEPALDAGIRLNRVYRDARYAVNHVTELEAPCRWQEQSMDVYTASNALFLTSGVDGEQCWHDHYWGLGCPMGALAPRDLLCVLLEGYGHMAVRDWYRNSFLTELANEFNHGLVAGAYWSVVGPGKNLQLSAQGGGYYFAWTNAETRGTMTFYDASQYPGRLPGPVTLIGPESGATVDHQGAVLSCQPSENAVGYQLLFGADPYHLVYLLSDTAVPPTEPVTSFPFEQTWWTVRAYDRYGSTIYADPLLLHAESVRPQTIQNSSTGQTYPSIQEAINDAHEGDEILLGAGPCQYLEKPDFKGKSVTLRSVDPNEAR